MQPKGAVILTVHANRDLTGNATSREPKVFEFARHIRLTFSSNPATGGAKAQATAGRRCVNLLSTLNNKKGFNYAKAQTWK
jgi:hypothetical protein